MGFRPKAIVTSPQAVVGTTETLGFQPVLEFTRRPNLCIPKEQRRRIFSPSIGLTPTTERSLRRWAHGANRSWASLSKETYHLGAKRGLLRAVCVPRAHIG
ncbi:hypothetical protein ES332_D11G120900v1 [Gossypium tomentosum]|uniref:Uncharacterized protein n=1 Tax=Gossypium tomentosum TaxID=34277 RepID=A0A5D2ILE2_GOSTO|nr:hypothetical protein ES332_D11G120900v1 [Gossypium tomentosum]